MIYTFLLGVTAMTILVGVPVEATSRLVSTGSRANAVPILVAVSEPAPAAPEPRFVRDAQRALRELGYAPGAIDGLIGAKTRSALTRYQQAQRLPPSGQLDAETMARLDIYLRVLRTNEERRADAHGGPSGRIPAVTTSR